MSWKEKLLYLLLTLALLGLMAVYVLEFYYFKRTFEIKTMSWVAALIGLADGALLGWLLSRKTGDAVERIQVFFFCLVLTTVFAPLIASMSNRFFSPHPLRWESVVFFEQKPYISERFGLLQGETPKPRGYYLFFIREGVMRRIDNRKPLTKAYQRGDTLQIPVRKGLWGVEWVPSWP